MFDLTVLPYFVFAFMAIPPFIFGYFKGWRSGLFTLLLTLITGGILVGISVGIYESALWPLFKGLFVSSHNPGNLDIESLKEISKTSVISVSVGIALLPGVLIMWGLYMAFKKLLNKYMQPKLKKISKNEVGIYRKNLKLTRAGGVVLNGAAGLIIASAAAGAVSTLTVPSNKSNFFNSMTNAIGDGMTFGQGQYNEDYQRMFEFVNDGAYYQNQIDSFRQAYGQVQKASGEFGVNQTTFANFVNPTGASKLKEHDKFIADTNLMAKDSEQISKALVLMLLSSSKAQRDFHLVGFDVASSDGSGTTRSNVDAVDAQIAASLTALESTFNSLQSNIKWNQAGVNAALKEFFGKRFVEFEKSPYYADWKNQAATLETAQDELDKRNERDSELNGKIPGEQRTQAGYVSEINNEASKVKSDWAKVLEAYLRLGIEDNSNYPSETFADVPTPDTSSAPWTSTTTYTNADGTQNTTNILKTPLSLSAVTRTNPQGSYYVQDKAHQDFDIADNLATNAESETANKQQLLREAESHTRDKRSYLDQTISSIEQHTKTRDAADKFINIDGPKKLAALNRQKSVADAALSKSKNDYRTLGTEKSVADLAASKTADTLVNANEARQKALRAFNEAKGKTTGLVRAFNDAKTKADQATNELNAANREVTRLTKLRDAIDGVKDPAAFTKADEALTKAKIKQTAAQTKSIAVQSLLSTATGARDANQVLVTQTQKAFNQKDGAQKDAQKADTAAQKAASEKTTQYNNKEIENDNNQKTVDRLASQIAAYNLELTRNKNTKTIDENELVRLNALKPNQTSDWKKAVADQGIAQGTYDVAKSKSDGLRAHAVILKGAFDSLYEKYKNDVNLINNLMKNINGYVTKAKTAQSSEQTLAVAIGKDIVERNHLEANVSDHASIKYQEKVVNESQTRLDQLEQQKNDAQDAYNNRKEELIEDITKALS